MITVWGTPAGQGSKRFLGKTKSGRGIMVETSDKTAPWRSSIINACTEYWRLHHDGTPVPFAEPVIARIIFCFPRPASVSRKKRPFMSVAPDLDKLIRACLDGLTAGGAIADDALVTEFTRVAKVYCGEDPEALDVPGAVIVLGRLVPLAEVGGTPPGGTLLIHDPLKLAESPLREGQCGIIRLDWAAPPHGPRCILEKHGPEVDHVWEYQERRK